MGAERSAVEGRVLREGLELIRDAHPQMVRVDGQPTVVEESMNVSSQK
jgi:hypothetical protein